MTCQPTEPPSQGSVLLFCLTIFPLNLMFFSYFLIELHRITFMKMFLLRFSPFLGSHYILLWVLPTLLRAAKIIPLLQICLFFSHTGKSVLLNKANLSISFVCLSSEFPLAYKKLYVEIYLVMFKVHRLKIFQVSHLLWEKFLGIFR